MYSVYVGLGFLLVLAFLLIQYRPATGGTEGFTIAAVHPRLSPACTARSTDAQALLARFAADESTDAAELRLLMSKLCCMEADISSPAAGSVRTQALQFRTSHDMDVASSIVGRCRAKAVNERDIELILDKFRDRGHELVRMLCPGDAGAVTEFDAVLGRLRWAMMGFCLHPQPSMDRPIGARDMGFWEPAAVADLSQYQGISAALKTN